MKMGYDWFRIHIKKSNGNDYSIHVTSSLDSREFEKDFTPPFNPRESEEMLRKIEESLKPRVRLLGHERLMKTGRSFYGSIFSAEVEKYFRECLKNAKRNCGLRIELVIDPLYLRRLPWELIHDGKDFLALSTVTPIVRTITQTEVPQLPEIPFPLGILFVAASPVGPHTSIDVGSEIRLLCKGISKEVEEGKVFLRCHGAKKVKNRDFLDDVKSKRFNVLHISSHGKFVEAIDKGLLQLEDENGKPFLVSVEALGAWLRDSSVQLVYLDACEMGVGSVRTPLADLGYVFLDKGVGAVVAMQFSVPVTCANTFCHNFYSQLVEGEPVEFCLSQARTRIIHPVFGLDTIDWAIPVLYMSGKGILHVGGEREPRRTYKKLPTLGLFIGRERELNKLMEHLVDPEVSVMSVDGFGGIGKSTTVNKLVTDVCCLFDDVCWIDCRTKLSYDEIIQGINEMLLYHGVGFTSDVLKKYLPEGRNQLIANALEQKEFVVVFDNFDSVQEEPNICSLVQKISEGKQTKVLVTLRTPISLARKQQFSRLNKLEEEDALLLMRRLGEQKGINSVTKAKDVVLKNINARVDGHPKAIEVVIPHLKTKPLEKVLEGLPQVLSGKIGPILEWSFNLLIAEEKEFLLEISVYEGEVRYDALEAVHIGDYPIPVAELVEKNLLTYDTERKLYSLHPLVQEYAYDQLRRERRRKLHRLAARYFLSEKGKDPVSAIYHRYKAEDWKHGIYITSKILDTLILRGFWTETKNLCEQGLIASRKIKDKEKESYFLFNLANMLGRLGNPDEAKELYWQSLKIDTKLGDQSGISATLHNLGLIEQHRGNYDEATKLYKQSLKIAEKLGDQSGISSTLHQLGLIEQHRGNYDEAAKLYKQSLKIAEKLGDQSGISKSLYQLANIQYLQGNYDEAEKLCKQSLEIDTKLGDQSGISISLHQLGLIEHEQGNYDEAEKLYKQSLKINQKIGDKSGIALTFGQLGRLSETRNQLTLAKQYYEKALEIFRQLGDKPHTNLAQKDLNRIQTKMKTKNNNNKQKK